MASIFDKYGIKEVADATFYEIESDGTPGVPVLYLDTLKVSTIEQTAEDNAARGGKGNPKLISWDFGKDIIVNFEDALFSAKSLAIMMGSDNETDSRVLTTSDKIRRTIGFTATSATLPTKWVDESGKEHTITPTVYDEEGEEEDTALVVGNKYLMTFEISVVSGYQIDVTASKFPGTYYITGDTMARSLDTGRDEFFQFVIPKGKVKAGNTISMEADGDPSVFSMEVEVLRAEGGNMLQLIKYDL